MDPADLSQQTPRAIAKMTWCENIGEHKIWGGASLMGDCAPHFHETYSIVHVTGGSITMVARGAPHRVCKGDVLLGNPYEIVSAYGADEFEYDVCYPSQGFMRTLVRSLGMDWDEPRFARLFLEGELAAEVGQIVSDRRCAFGGGELWAFEQRLAVALARNPQILEPASAERSAIDCVGRAFALLDSMLDEPLSVNDLCRKVEASRSYFVRSFSSQMGLPPSRYIRQLRLARGLERVLAGAALAEAAIASGFADQAHFTREFKRVYGTTPGALNKVAHRP
jgi:AraC-like DNA-binding protein